MTLLADHRRPSILLSTGVVLVLTIIWGIIRLWVFQEIIFPLTFVLPLLICVWTRRPWQLWTMAGIFCAMAVVKVAWILPDDLMTPREVTAYFIGITLNLIIGSLVVHWIIRLRENLEERNATVSAQNQELEAQTEELVSQNEEIKIQAEELASQNEEIESQAEEAARQNEELIEINDRLLRREGILQNLLRSSRSAPSLETVQEVCERALAVVGLPANAVILLHQHGEDRLKVKAQIGFPESLPTEWMIEGSVAKIVLAEEKTAYVSDLTARPDLAAPFGENPPFRSILATPVRFAEETTGILAVAAVDAGHWSDEQFRVIEWIAAQFGILLEAQRWQEALTSRARELEAANRSKDRFLAMLSHELRTPLTPVIAAACALEGDPLAPDHIREDLRMILRNVRIQSRLIDDLLDLTRIDQGKIDLHREQLKIAPLLRDAAAIVASDLDAKSQTLSIELVGVDDAVVNGDNPRLQQVIWNLLKNASKFSPTGTQIRLHAEVVNGSDRVRIAVHDQGVGIAAADVSRIFAPFEQVLEGPGRRSDAGLGLGLAIAKALVEMHGGEISLSSPGDGQGASFFVEFPLVERSKTATHESGGSESTPRPTRETAAHILLVEDHADTGLILSRFLTAAGFRVNHAASAGEAWQHFQQRPYDLIISDLGLPDESGLDLMRRLKEHHPELPAICLSGFGMEEDKRASAEAGFHEHVTKPVEFPRLEAAITRVLARSATSLRS